MESFRFRRATVEILRRRCVLESPPLALEGRQRAAAPVPKLLDGEWEARVIAMRLGLPLPCYGSGPPRLPERQVVEVGIVDSISHEIMGHPLRKGTISLWAEGIYSTIDGCMLYME